MKQVVLKNNQGQYFVDGRGFNGTKQDATRINEDQADCKIKCAAAFGVSAITEDVTKSWAVVYIRKNDSVSLTSVNKLAPNAAAGQFDPSKRRFATDTEAKVHAGRFHARRAKRGDAPGTAGHIGAFVVETNDPVNSFVNFTTGLTNSL